MSSTTNTNPGNFANRPTEEVKAIASMGGKASHKNDAETGISHLPASATDARNDDGTFTNGSEAAKEAGHLGGLHAAGKLDGRNEDGTFMKDSEAAKEAGHLGGLHAAGKLDGRNEDGTFKKGSEAAKEAGHKGGLVAAENRVEV